MYISCLPSLKGDEKKSSHVCGIPSLDWDKKQGGGKHKKTAPLTELMIAEGKASVEHLSPSTSGMKRNYLGHLLKSFQQKKA